MAKVHRRALIALLMLRRREDTLSPSGPEDMGSLCTVTCRDEVPGLCTVQVRS